MSSNNGYFDTTQNKLIGGSVEQWQDLTSWENTTSWQGTPGSQLFFTSNIIDAGFKALHLPVIRFDSGAPVTITVQSGDTVDSAGGEIDSPTTTTITPGSTVSAINARFFKFTLTQGTGDSASAEDSAGSPELFLANLDINFVNRSLSFAESNIDTSDLAGSTGARELSLGITTGTITNCIVQPHIKGFDDSAGDPVRPLVYIDKTSDPIVLNIFDADSYGKNRRIDCTVDIQVQYLPLCSSDDAGNTEVTED